MEAQSTESSSGQSSLNVCCGCKNDLASRDPILLMCLHSFCQSCLPALKCNPSETNAENENFVCSVCKQETNETEVIYNEFVSHLSVNSEPQNNICQGCEELTIATSFCKDCGDWLCEQCVYAHRRVRVTKDHRIEPVENMEEKDVKGRVSFCKKHPRESLKFYCFTCEMLTCRDCQLNEHPAHDFKAVSVACDDHKVWLLSMVEKLQEKVGQMEFAQNFIDAKFNDITDHEKKFSDELKREAVLLITAINKRGKMLLEDLEQLCRGKKTELAVRHSTLAALLERYRHAVEFTDEILRDGSDASLLKTRTTVRKQIQSLVSAHCQIPNPNYKFELQFQHDSSIINAINEFGSITYNGVLMANGNAAPTPRPSISPTSTTNPSLASSVRPVNHPVNIAPRQLSLLLQPPALQRVTTGAVNVVTKNIANAFLTVSSPTCLPKDDAAILARTCLPKDNAAILARTPQTSSESTIARTPNTPQQGSNQISSSTGTTQHRRILPATCTSSSGIDSAKQVSQPGPGTSRGTAPKETTPQSNGDVPTSPAVPSSPAKSTDSISITPAANYTPASTSGAVVPPLAIRVKQEKIDSTYDKASCANVEPPSPVSTSLAEKRKTFELVLANNSVTSPSRKLRPGLYETLGYTRDDYEAATTSTDVMARQSAPGSVAPPAPSAPMPIMFPAFTDTGNGDIMMLGDPNEDWCAVCHNGGDLLCCEKCPHVFHIQCHVPALDEAPRGEWICGLCTPEDCLRIEQEIDRSITSVAIGSKKRKTSATLLPEEISACQRVLLELFCHDSSVPFHLPVSKNVPDYHAMVSTPMDFTTIKSKLNPEHSSHYKSIQEFVSDIALVFKNCKIFNGDKGELTLAAVKVESFFIELLNKFVPYCCIQSGTIGDYGRPQGNRLVVRGLFGDNKYFTKKL